MEGATKVAVKAGGEDPRAVKALGASVFRYWNSIVETSLKGSGYDFSQMPDKDEAAKSATPAKAIPAMGKRVDALAASVTGKGPAACFPRELRDLDDAREKLGLCARLLAATGLGMGEIPLSLRLPTRGLQR